MGWGHEITHTHTHSRTDSRGGQPLRSTCGSLTEQAVANAHTHLLLLFHRYKTWDTHTHLLHHPRCRCSHTLPKGGNKAEKKRQMAIFSYCMSFCWLFVCPSVCVCRTPFLIYTFPSVQSHLQSVHPAEWWQSEWRERRREIEVEVEKDGGKQKRHCERRNGLSEDIYNRFNETTCLSDMQRSSSPSGETVMPARWC